MFDLATELVMGFNPDTIHSPGSSLKSDWALVNEWLVWRCMTEAFPYWNYRYLKTKGVVAFDAAMDRIRASMLAYVTRCHRSCVENPTKEPTSALEYYFLTEKESICELNDKECVDHGLNFIWGSIDSTRSTLVYSVLAGARNPETLVPLREEVDRVLKDGLPSATQLMNEMPQTQAFISEVLRFNPAFAVIPHELDEDITVAEGRYATTQHVVY